MVVPVGAIINISGKIAEYFGLIEGVDTKVTKLLHQAFNSARLNLLSAQNATGQNQIDYIKEAKNKFMEAISVEENENKVLAFAGLAMCQLFLKDETNAQLNIQRIDDVQLTTSAEFGAVVREPRSFMPGIGSFIMDEVIRQRQNELESTKRKAHFLCVSHKSINGDSVEPASSELNYYDIINRL